MSPKVAWTGDSWQVEDFLMDVEAAVDALNPPSESEGMPGLTFGVVMTALGLAAVAVGPRRELDE